MLEVRTGQRESRSGKCLSRAAFRQEHDRGPGGQRMVSLLPAVLEHSSPLHDAAPSSNDVVSRQSVLIFFDDPLAAALIGAAVELAGHATHFAQSGETARAALRRARPQAVLIDCNHEESCQDAFVGPALMTGARVILLRTPRTQRDVRELTEHCQVAVLDLPAEIERLAELLRAGA